MVIGSQFSGNGGGNADEIKKRSGSHGATILEEENGQDEQPPKKAPPRKTRYGRSATTSVTQMLSTSCNTLLQKFRRNPSERPEKKLARSTTQLATSQQRYYLFNKFNKF